MRDPRVEAIRTDSLVGEGSCASIDECFEDDELVELLDLASVKTPLEAVKWARKNEGLSVEQGLNARWGEDDDPQLKAHEEWKQKLAANPLK